MKKVKKLAGWGTRGRPFSPTEYKKTYLKSKVRMGYSEYLCQAGKNVKKRGSKKAFG